MQQKYFRSFKRDNSDTKRRKWQIVTRCIQTANTQDRRVSVASAVQACSGRASAQDWSSITLFQYHQSYESGSASQLTITPYWETSILSAWLHTACRLQTTHQVTTFEKNKSLRKFLGGDKLHYTANQVHKTQKLKLCSHARTCIAYMYDRHVRDTCCNYVYSYTLYARTGSAYMYAMPVRNTCLQYVCTCVHVCRYMYATLIQVRTCKHRINLGSKTKRKALQ